MTIRGRKVYLFHTVWVSQAPEWYKSVLGHYTNSTKTTVWVDLIKMSRNKLVTEMGKWITQSGIDD